MSNREKKFHAIAWLLARPWLLGLIVFLLMSSACFLIARQRYQLYEREERQNAMNIAESAENRLEQTIQYSASAAKALTLTIDKDGIPRNFDSVAASILQNNTYIDALQLVPDGTIQYVYPLKGNEPALGYNILADSTRNKEAYKAIEKKELFFAGPLELKQGGIGIVGRLPVFLNQRFWGFSAVIIRLHTLLNTAGIDTSGKTGYYFQLSKINPDTQKEEFFLPQKKQSAAWSEIVSIPAGEWKLSVTPVNDHKALDSIVAVGILGFILSLTTALFIVYLGQTPARLQRMVWQKSAALEKSESRNRAIVNALPDMAFVINKQGKIIDYNNPPDTKQDAGADRFVGKHVKDVMPPGLADEFQRYLSKALSEKQLLTHSYQQQVENELKDYEARYITQSNEDVLVMVRDITETKRAEQRIRESEQKYRTLVEQAADGIFIGDFRGNILVVNPAGCKLAQYSEEELMKMKIHDFTLPDQLQAMPFKFEELLAGKTAMSERIMKRKSGELIDVEITAKIIAPDRFLVFVRDITERKKASQEIIKSREDLRKLTNHMENVREQERLNIAREIHDELGQQLTVLKMDVSRLGRKINAADKSCEREINDILDAIHKMVEVVRKISTDLRPGLLDDLGLVAAIEWYCNDYSKRTGIKTSFIPAVISEDRLPQKVNISIFRILQESLTNVARHANAAKVDISLDLRDEQLVLIIEDNGRGFSPEEVKDKKTLGIMGMKERALMIGGSYHISSAPGRGTIIEVIVPLGAQLEAGSYEL